MAHPVGELSCVDVMSQSRIAIIYVSWLRFGPPWLTHTEMDTQTALSGYIPGGS